MRKQKKVIHKEIKECQLHYQERSKEIQVLIFYLEARIFQDNNETQLLRMKFKNKCDLLPYSEKDGSREELKKLENKNFGNYVLHQHFNPSNPSNKR